MVHDLTPDNLDDSCGKLTEEKAVVTDDDNSALEGLQRVLQEFTRRDVQMVRGFVQYEELARLQKELRESHTRFLAEGGRRAVPWSRRPTANASAPREVRRRP
eukprot:CAMPEP_0117598940 /NCGR_PEP_ID=MMETSP0784-20121206/75676_1 /TAXON_ID=39447 /ORGANISM="" /LENGTH=102 /DNA_ID=CAMNT_0005401447 /DNA_START=320 /DNA_END=625 /DNA_ORIENTATION=+